MSQIIAHQKLHVQKQAPDTEAAMASWTIYIIAPNNAIWLVLCLVDLPHAILVSIYPAHVVGPQRPWG